MDALALVKVQKEIIAANSKSDDHAKHSAEAPPKDESKAQDAKIAKAQKEITNIQKKAKLVRTATLHWVPSAAMDPSTLGADATVARQIEPRPIFLAWLLPGIDLKTVAGVPKPIQLQIKIDRRTQGTTIPNVTFGPDGKNSLDNPGGLLVRDPAKGTLRACYNECAEQGNDLVETTDDVIARQAMWLPQFGQIRVYPEHSALFENATLSVSLNSDGTVASAGYHSASTAATGIAGLGAAGTAASTVETNRNTAISAENTAKTTQVAYPDTINKSLADCLAQQTLILKLGGTPVPCQ
jgi:hypothetical protein